MAARTRLLAGRNTDPDSLRLARRSRAFFDPRLFAEDISYVDAEFLSLWIVLVVAAAVRECSPFVPKLLQSSSFAKCGS